MGLEKEAMATTEPIVLGEDREMDVDAEPVVIESKM